MMTSKPSKSNRKSDTKGNGPTPPVPVPTPANNPALSAFLSPASRSVLLQSSKDTPSPPKQSTTVPATKPTPTEVAHKIASLLQPGPPFYSQVDNAHLVDILADASLMNCLDGASPSTYESQKGGDKAAAAGDAKWTQKGTVWSALGSLPVGASWQAIPHVHSAVATTPSPGDIKASPPAAPSKVPSAAPPATDDGLWSDLSLLYDLSTHRVALNRSVVLPSRELAARHFFEGNAGRALSELAVGVPHRGGGGGGGRGGITYSWDDFTAAVAEERRWAGAGAGVGMLGGFAPGMDLFAWAVWAALRLGGAEEPALEMSSPPPTGGSKRIWVPSPTALSFQASWWGYTLYLPEPVMTKLNADASSAEKIALSISGALQAIVSEAGKLSASLPPEMKAILQVLKAVAPVTQYVATFIGWSWEEVRKCDKGKGVCLSATWILPVALIPRAWDAPEAGAGAGARTPKGGATPPATPPSTAKPLPPAKT